MSKTPSPTKTGSKKQLPLEAPPDPASKPESSKLSSCLLTVENVKKHQEENPVAKSDLAQWSIETYIEESNRFLNESDTNAEGSREQVVSNEEESRVLHEGYPENTDQTLGKDFQTRPLSAPVPETQSPKKREVADLETQTEWSYSVSSEDSSELKIEKEQQRSTDRQKKSETTEGNPVIPSNPVKLPPAFRGSERAGSGGSQGLQDHSVTDLFLMGRCEFCTSLLKRLPSPEELEEKPEAMDHFLCCRTYKEVFQCVIQDFMEKPGSEIDIRPHARLSFAAMESKTRTMLIDELLERGFERYREIFMQYMKFGPCEYNPPAPVSTQLLSPNEASTSPEVQGGENVFPFFRCEEERKMPWNPDLAEILDLLSSALRCISGVNIKFRLSDYPPKPESAILKERHPEPKELLEIDWEFKAEQLKVGGSPGGSSLIFTLDIHFLNFNYRVLFIYSTHGCPTHKVLCQFTNLKLSYLRRNKLEAKDTSRYTRDGGGEALNHLLLSYPSGRLAVLITYLSETQFTYSVLGDSRDQEPLAFFTNQGHAAHYWQKGKLRLHLDLCNGSVFDEKGQQQKFWNWWDTKSHIHAPPFQPICLLLNLYIQVNIKAQDQVFLTFTKFHDSLHLNVGARLKLKDPSMLWVLQQYGTTEHLVRPSVLEKIRKILTKVKKVLKKLDSDPSKEAADLHPVLKVYERMHHNRR
ncbi:hypothetical protein E2320_004963 [Naja naja]|nr:hypothetical protein E2320_004963 [Naja naja]